MVKDDNAILGLHLRRPCLALHVCLLQRFCAPRGSPADPQLLSGTWEGAAVSAKLFGFHVVSHT